MAVVTNPILPGFHPDPSIVFHDGWFYLATSTFEWWPGVQLNRSRDLVSWELAGYALTRRSQLDLRGVPDSGGVWAPALSYADGQFWLVYSDMKAFAGPFKDVRNYLVTAPAIEGPWCDPVFLNASGFDPSLFHDVDGRKWLLNQNWLPTGEDSSFDGIVLQEFSPATKSLIGEPRKIFAGSALGTTEGPHLYRKDGYYYLLTAEGGTSWNHAVTVARSRERFGPYELSPTNPLLTSAHRPDAALQKAGHGSLVQDPSGRWFLAHLCSRPVPGTRRCILGRETALQPIAWPDGGWPALAGGGSTPLASFEIPGAGRPAQPCFLNYYDPFDATELSPHWNTLREPADPTWLSLREKPGALRLRGRHSIQSLFDHSLVGLRVAHLRCEIRAEFAYQPESRQQRAGLALYYNARNFYFLYVSAGEQGRFANVLVADNGVFREEPAPVPLPPQGTIELRAQLEQRTLALSCGVDGGELMRVGGDFDATILSDDYPLETNGGWAFTGVFAALCAQDSTGRALPADFESFRYRGLSS